jgi:hypothetical protein
MDYTGLIIGVGAGATALIGQVYFLGRRMSEPEKMLVNISDGLTIEQQSTIDHYKEWLSSAKLQFQTAFLFGRITAAVFQEEDQPRFFSFLFHPYGVIFSAESYLEDSKIVDTTNSRNLGMFPRPGAYAQGFPHASAQETWQKHLEGEIYLRERFGLKLASDNRPYQELVIAAMRIRMKYNCSQFLWPVRVLVRYFVTRHFMVNRTIAQQYP